MLPFSLRLLQVGGRKAGFARDRKGFVVAAAGRALPLYTPTRTVLIMCSMRTDHIVKDSAKVAGRLPLSRTPRRGSARHRETGDIHD